MKNLTMLENITTHGRHVRVNGSTIDVGLNSNVITSLNKYLPKVPYAAGFGLQCAGATTLAGVLSGHYLPNFLLTVFNAPQLTYYSYLYEQQITTLSILSITHTTK